MNIIDWFKDRFKKQAVHYSYVPIPKERVRYSDGTEPDDTALVAGEHYFRLWLVEMFLENDRDWFANWHPAVHSAIDFRFGSQNQVISRVAGPSALKNLDDQHLDRVIQQNHELTSLLPFNGGSVQVSCGLLAMQGGNDVKAFLKVLGDFSKLLAVPELSSALAVAEPVADGVFELVGATDGQLMLGLDQTYSGAGGGAEAVLRAGYYAIVLADENELEMDKFWVDKDQLKYGEGFDAAKHLTGHNYMLLRTECRDKRDDWDSLSAIQEPYEKAIEMLKLQQLDKAEEFLRAAVASAYTSRELTQKVDRRRVISRLKDRFDEAKGDLGMGAFAQVEPTLSSLMQDAMSVHEARAKPEMSPMDAFSGLD